MNTDRDIQVEDVSPYYVPRKLIKKSQEKKVMEKKDLLRSKTVIAALATALVGFLQCFDSVQLLVSNNAIGAILGVLSFLTVIFRSVASTNITSVAGLKFWHDEGDK